VSLAVGVAATVGTAASVAQEPCSCVSPAPERWFGESELVFRGKVTRVERVAFREVTAEGAAIVRSEYVTFKPSGRFKGPKADLYGVSNAKCSTPEVSAAFCRAPCAELFEVGAEFVVFAFPDGEEPPNTDRCRVVNVAANKAQADHWLKWLRANK
jgi:hypothetical protein